MASACSSGTPGENIGHVPSPTFETRNPLLPKFLYRNPGVGVPPWRIVSAGFEPKLIERPDLIFFFFFAMKIQFHFPKREQKKPTPHII